MKKTMLLVLLCTIKLTFAQGIDKSLYVFDFEFNNPISERASLLTKKGFAGVTFSVNNEKNFQKLQAYLNTEEVKSGKLEIPVVYVPYHFSDQKKIDPIWKKVLALDAKINLWVIFVNKDNQATKEKTFALLEQMTTVASKYKKDIVIYPHDNTFIESAEEALPYIESLNKDNLKLTFHLSHEMRAGNKDRLLKVALKAAPYLTYASISGSDVTMRPNHKADWSDAIKPLDEGDFDTEEFVMVLQKIGFKGKTVLHTFGIKKDKSHLDRSFAKWNQMVKSTYNKLNTDPQVILDNPENAYWDKNSKAWYISSLGGEEVTIAEDGYGWLTKIDENFNIVANRWIDGLDAPTGMASYKNFLYVADRGVVVKIDTKKERIVKKIKIKGSRFLNDIAVAKNGDIYVSDTYENTIFKINKKDEVENFFTSDVLENPNGLWVEKDVLIVATWGPMTNEATFATSRKGRLLKLDLKTKKTTFILEKPEGNFDGVVKYNNHYYATDWTGGRLLKISEEGVVTEIATGFKQFADLGIHPEQGVLMIPEMSKNRFITIRIKE